MSLMQKHCKIVEDEFNRVSEELDQLRYRYEQDGNTDALECVKTLIELVDESEAAYQNGRFSSALTKLTPFSSYSRTLERTDSAVSGDGLTAQITSIRGSLSVLDSLA